MDPLKPGMKTSETIAGLGGTATLFLAASSGALAWDHRFTIPLTILAIGLIASRTAVKIAAIFRQKEPDHASE